MPEQCCCVCFEPVVGDAFQEWAVGGEDRAELQPDRPGRFGDGVEALLELGADGLVVAELPRGQREPRLQAVASGVVDRAGEWVVIGEPQVFIAFRDVPDRGERPFPEVVQAGGQVGVLVGQCPGEVENYFVRGAQCSASSVSVL